MQISDLDFQFPEELIAIARDPVTRVMLVEGATNPLEITVQSLIQKFVPGDVLVINDTKVLKRRVFTESGLEILFLAPSNSLGTANSREWTVLCPSSRWKQGSRQVLPQGVELELVSRGRPQTVRANRSLNDEYFEQNGEMPLPPYIQKARGERHNRSEDASSYQTDWAQKPGSLAAPTASLHFSENDLEALRARGVKLVKITLHVGLGTFLPITASNLDEHEMHFEWSEISAEAWQIISGAKAQGKKIWALGTTVARTLESAAHGLLNPEAGGFSGETNLFIRPGFEYKVIDRLLTNFHQPQSTLLALVAAFAGLEKVKAAYAWAIERKFRLFSYGDLTVWIR